MRVPSSAAGGFTLVEIMIVLVILGLVSALAVIRAPAGRAQLEREATRFAAAIDLMSEQAIVRGIPHALDVDAEQYRLREFQRGAWQPKALAGIASDYTLPPPLRLELASDAIAGERANRIVLLPSGETTSAGFSVTNTINGETVSYVTNSAGHFERVP